MYNTYMLKALKVQIHNTIFKTPFHLVRFIGLLFIPFIYGFFYIYAFYDPFVKVDQVPLAIITERVIDEDGIPQSDPFSEAMGRELSKEHDMKIGDVKMTTKMKHIYLDSKVTDTYTNEQMIDRAQKMGEDYNASIFVPNFYNVASDFVKNVVNFTPTLVNVISAFTTFKAMVDKMQNQPITIISNFKKSYLIAFGIDLGTAMLGSSQLTTTALINVMKDPAFQQGLYHDGVATISELKKLDDAMDDIVASDLLTMEPIELKSEMGGEDAKYGYGLAPFFICVAMWIGGMAMTFAVHRKIYDDSISPMKRYFLKGLIINTSVFIQATILMLSLYIIGFHKLGINHWFSMYMFAVFIGFAFSQITQAIRFSIHSRNLGVFMIIIFLVLQMASAGGLFPSETQAPFYQYISHLGPIHYGINILRQLTFNTNWAIVFENVGYLFIFFLVIPLGMFINFRRTMKLYLRRPEPMPEHMIKSISRWHFLTQTRIKVHPKQKMYAPSLIRRKSLAAKAMLIKEKKKASKKGGA